MKKKKKDSLGHYFDSHDVRKLIGLDTQPCLYILMRSDLHSLNPGKAMAQASHAANAMAHKIKQAGRKNIGKHIYNMLTKWEGQTGQGFGTCLVLDCHNEETMIDTLALLHSNDGGGDGVVSEIINDTSYPVRDGEITHYISVNTCAYAFIDKNDEALCSSLSHLNLYK